MSSPFRVLRRLLSYHSRPLDTKFNKFKVKAIPALEDNYMYLLIDNATNQAAAVDAVEPDKIIKAVKEENVHLTAVLTTHHHWDHAGGNEDLISKVKGLSVYGGDKRIDGLTKQVTHNSTFDFGSLSVKSLFTPGHTTGHYCFFIEGAGDAIAFTGDTLFVGGCGRVFEGTSEQMYNSVVKILGRLPPSTKFFCGHEYTINNLKFAEFVDPLNMEVRNKLRWAKEQRKNNVPTIPSTMNDELHFNPFMRVNRSSLQARCETTTGVDTFAFLRSEKDSF